MRSFTSFSSARLLAPAQVPFAATSVAHAAKPPSASPAASLAASGAFVAELLRLLDSLLEELGLVQRRHFWDSAWASASMAFGRSGFGTCFFPATYSWRRVSVVVSTSGTSNESRMSTK